MSCAPDNDLGLAGRSLGGEVDDKRNVLDLIQLVHQVVLDVHTLPCSCGPHEEHGTAIGNHQVLKIGEATKKQTQQFKEMQLCIHA